MSRVTQQRFRERCSATSRALAGCLLISTLLLLLLAAVPSSAAAGTLPCDCASCHDANHEGGCSGCHASPPQTVAHLTHFNSPPFESGRYGDTTVQSTAEAYMFGCGNCHPLDTTKHADGVVEVELYDALAPGNSLKARNLATAAYDPATRTCTDVYCHSGYVVSSGQVGLPLTTAIQPAPSGTRLNGSYIMDETCSNLTYAPYQVFAGRAYVPTPAWGTTGNFTTCTECHEFPLTTYYPEVYAGVGDSHQWVDDYGWNWRHAYNMWGDPIPCRTCHNDTVKTAGPTRWVGSIIAYDPIPLASRAAHINGTADVAFDTLNGFTYSWTGRRHTLANATYDSATKTCSNVTCHYNPIAGNGLLQVWQEKPKWGAPWRDEHESGAECDVCHRYGYLSRMCGPVIP